MEVTPKPGLPLDRIPQYLETEEEVQKFYQYCQRNPTLSPARLEVIEHKCTNQIHLLRLRGNR